MTDQLSGQWVIIGLYTAVMLVLVVDFALQFRQGFAVGAYGSTDSAADEHASLLRPGPGRVALWGMSEARRERETCCVQV